MVAERELCAIDERLHRLSRIHVLIAHEPARLVGPNWQNGEPDRVMNSGQRLLAEDQKMRQAYMGI